MTYTRLTNKLVSFTLMLIAVPAMAFAQANSYQNVMVNEIMAANIDQEIDPSYNYGGWIELYNSGDKEVSLLLYITDAPGNQQTPLRGTIPAKGYKRYWFDHNSADGEYGDNADDQIRFHMEAGGGTLYFYDVNDALVFTQEYPASIARCSYCRTTDGASTWGWTATPTPEATNNNSVYASQILDAPVVSENSKLFTDSFKFNVEVPEGATLCYTTDGSTPSLSNGTQKTQTTSFSVSSATRVYRFRLFKDGYLPSAVVTRSYIYKNKNYTLPIVSIVTKRANLYDSTIGVYVDGTNGITGRGKTTASNKNMDWERPVNFDYIINGEGVLSAEGTFTVCGGWSRHNTYSSFKIKAEKLFDGNKFFAYPFFDEKPYIRNKALMLRNGGNDYGCRSKDATAQHIISSSGYYVDGQSFNPCHVFVNGTYLTVLNMREPSNKHFAYANYGIDTDEVDALEITPDTNPKLKFMAGTNTSFKEMLNLANTCSDETVYNNIVTNYLDIDEYINYMASESWLGGTDWLTNNNNTKGFKGWNGGRWHFVLFDLDFAFYSKNMLTSLKNNNTNDMTILFNRLAKNESFKKQFVTSYCIFDGSIFTAERAQEGADFVGNALDDGLSLSNQDPWSSCNDIVNNTKNQSDRNTRMNALKNFFSLGNSANVSIGTNVSDAAILINGMDCYTGKFDGTLYPPFTISTTAPAGYNFVGWKEGTKTVKTLFSRASTWSYYDQGSLDGQNWKTGTISSWKSGTAPLGYSKDGIKTTLDYGGDSNNKRPAYYFRKEFTIDSDPTSADAFVLDYSVDDGFVIYINGKEVARHLFNDGTISYSTYATNYSSGNPDVGSITLDYSSFKKGTNIIAVEVHNNSATSSDIYWDAALTLETNDGSTMNTERILSIESGSGNLSYTAMYEKLPDEYLQFAGQTPVVVNEISAGNDIFINDYYKKSDWVELYNTTDAAIDVAGMYLSDDSSDKLKYQIPAGTGKMPTTIPAHGHLIIWADKLDPLWLLHAPYKLGNDNGQCVVLTSKDLSWSNTLEYDEHAATESVGRFPDGGKCVYRMDFPTIGKRNILTSYASWLYGEDKNFTDQDYANSIETTEELQGEGEARYFNLNGVELEGPQRGVNIVKYANGKTKKIIVK